MIRRTTEQEILKANKLHALQHLTAPIDGAVINLAARTIGGIVKSGDAILNIVPLYGIRD